MEILRKVTNCKSLENSQANFYDRVSFSQVISSDCNFAIKRISHRLFLENVPKTSSLKRIKKVFFEKKSVVDQCLNKAAGL